MPNSNVGAFASDATPQNGATANGNGTVVNVGGLTGVMLQVANTNFTATINPEGTLDDATWPSPGLPAINVSTGQVAYTITAPGLYFVPVAGIDQFRARISGYTSGSVTVYAKGVSGTSPFVIVTGTSGATAAPVNLSAVGGSAVATGQQSMANSIPVTIASNQSNLPTSGAADVTGTVGIAGLGQASSLNCTGLTSVSVVLTGTWVATLAPQVSVDGGTTWSTTQFYNPTTQQFTTTATANGTYEIVGTGGCSQARVISTAFTSGSVSGTLRASAQAGDVVTSQSLANAWDPVSGTFTLSRAATADAMSAAAIPAGAEVVWNGASFDRQRSPNAFTGDALTSTADERTLLWAILLELSRIRVGMTVMTDQDLADAFTTADLEV